MAGSWNLTTAKAATIARTATDALSGGADGVVITHGTDVIEETAWLVELLVRSLRDEPVVLCASMRHASEFGGDGPRNLLDALRVASDRSSRGRGTMLCVNGQLHHARWVTKTHATSVSTFESPERGPIGEVGELDVRFSAPSPAAPPPMAGDLDANVAVIGSHWDTDAELIPWHLSRGVDGFVVEACGAGNVNSAIALPLLDALAAGVPVVVATRCRKGEATPIYGGVGGFATLHGAGARSSQGLSAGKARLALQVAIGHARQSGDSPSAGDLFDRLATVTWTDQQV